MDASAEMLKDLNFNIQVSMHPKDRESFVKQFSEAAFKQPKGFFQDQKKRGIIIIEIFIAGTDQTAKNLEMLGYQVQRFNRGEFSCMVNDHRLFWKLVRHGFGIGDHKVKQAA